MKWFKWCKHKYIKIAFKEVYSRMYNCRYSIRLYKCKECGKEKWVDGRDDYLE